MKLIILNLIICLCRAANFKCQDSLQNQKFCTKEYLPVSCISEQILFYALRECESYRKQAIFCHPDDSQYDSCTEEYRPVCGVFDNKDLSQYQSKSKTYSNSCFACIDENVSYYIHQSCEETQNKKKKIDQDKKINLIFNLLN
ncbi:hypothetical protein ABPG72_019134 [Tetrahymena utriculariae]